MGQCRVAAGSGATGNIARCTMDIHAYRRVNVMPDGSIFRKGTLVWCSCVVRASWRARDILIGNGILDIDSQGLASVYRHCMCSIAPSVHQSRLIPVKPSLSMLTAVEFLGQMYKIAPKNCHCDCTVIMVSERAFMRLTPCFCVHTVYS